MELDGTRPALTKNPSGPFRFAQFAAAARASRVFVETRGHQDRGSLKGTGKRAERKGKEKGREGKGKGFVIYLCFATRPADLPRPRYLHPAATVLFSSITLGSVLGSFRGRPKINPDLFTIPPKRSTRPRMFSPSDSAKLYNTSDLIRENLSGGLLRRGHVPRDVRSRLHPNPNLARLTEAIRRRYFVATGYPASVPAPGLFMGPRIIFRTRYWDAQPRCYRQTLQPALRRRLTTAANAPR